VVVLLAWPGLNIAPGVGIDPSWQVALQMATQRGLDWGTQIIFSYGPLGFLATPLAMYGGLSFMSAVYAVAVLIGLSAAYLWAGRRGGISVWLVTLVAFAAVYISTLDVVVAIALICSTTVLGRNPPTYGNALLLYGGGVLCGIESLVKLNSGLTIVAIVVVTVVALPGRRVANLARFAATALLTFAVLWFATGQGVGNVVDYVTTSIQIIGGYSAVMGIDHAPGWTIAGGLVLIAAVLTATVMATRDLPRARRVAIIVATALVAFAGWKEGFVRHDSGHMAYFFSWMLPPWIAVVAPAGGRWRWIGLAGFAATVALYFAATGYQPDSRLNLAHNASLTVTQIHDLVDPAARARARETARFVDILEYAVPQRMVKEIGDRPVDIYPWDASIAWALGLNWDPEPVFQTYTAYTPDLDHRNAAALESSGGPRLILRHLTVSALHRRSSIHGLDKRYTPYDTPAATLAMLCNFRPAMTAARYELLERTADRCGAPRPIGSITAPYGRTVPVPKAPHPNEIVLARVHGLSPSIVERLWTLAYRAVARYVTFDHSRTYRLVAANAGDGLILSAPSRIDYPAPFRLAPDARSVAFEKQDTVAGPSGSVRIDFYVMPIRPYARPAAQGSSSAGSSPSSASLSR
jgi:hypothetical protein